MVDEWPTIEETKKHLFDGAVAVLKSVEKGDLTEEALNQNPPLKYHVLFFVMPILFAFFRSLDISLFTSPLQPRIAGNV